MPGRSSTRARCTSAGADTTTTASTALLAAGLEQQRNVEHDHAARLRFGLGQKSLSGLAHQRMHDRFEPLAAPAIAEHALAELAAIDLAVVGRARKRRLDRGAASPS